VSCKGDSEFLDLAYQQAVCAFEVQEVPVGAVIVRDGVVIASAYNFKEQTRNTMAHAEMRAIDLASRVVMDWRLSGCTLYSTLEPCPMCFGAILHARLDRVVYGAKDLKWGACGTVVDLGQPGVFNHTVKIDYLPDAKCADILTAFFKARRSSR
jgi:tRNA(adenine34) deaminase